MHAHVHVQKYSTSDYCMCRNGYNSKKHLECTGSVVCAKELNNYVQCTRQNINIELTGTCM